MTEPAQRVSEFFNSARVTEELASSTIDYLRRLAGIEPGQEQTDDELYASLYGQAEPAPLTDADAELYNHFFPTN